MRNKLLSIFLATLMIFGGSFSAFAVPVILDYIGPIDVAGPQSAEVVMPKINTYLVDAGYDPFLWMEKIEAWGTIDDYIYFTPPQGGITTYTLHYANPIPDVIWNEDTMSYDIVPSDPPRDLEYFIIKSATNAYVMILPEPLALGETLEVTLPADISHLYVAAYESPTEIYSIISGYKYNAEGIEIPISGVSFDFEIFDSEDNLVVTAYSDPNTGEMYFTMLDELGDPIPDMIDLLSLELPEGVYTIYELDETGYEFVRYELRDSLGALISQGNTDPFFEFTSSNDIDFTFYFYNQLKTSEITGIKVDGEGEPIPGVSFDFEIYNELDELIATAQSDSSTGVLSFIPTGEVDPVNPLVLPYGLYSIKEVTATEYDYLGYELWLDGVSDSSGVSEEIDFMVGDVDTIHFIFSNEIKTSDITGIKVDPEGNPILDMNFDFEIYNDLDELIATAESHETTGELWFLPVGELTPVTPLVLPYGDYSIKELTVTEYTYLGYELWEDGVMVGSGTEEEIDFMAGEVDEIRFIFTNELKTSEITGIKVDVGENPIEGVVFDFEIRDNQDALVATATSDPVTGELIFTPLGEVTPATPFILPYGYYTITELDEYGFTFVSVDLYEDGSMVGSSVTPTIGFNVGDVDEIRFMFKNTMTYNYETAYAIYGPDGGGELNDIRGNKNWGWYIAAPDLAEGESQYYDIYAGAGQNDISKGTYVGQVEVGIEDGYYVTTFHLIDIVILDEVHFGTYEDYNDIPKAPGLYTNDLPAVDVKFFVIHMVVGIPMLIQ